MSLPLFPFVSGGSFAGLFTLVAVLWGCLVIALHIAIFIGISQDAKRKESGGLFFFGPIFWGLCGLVFGLLGLAVYWMIHHSSLRRSTPVTSDRPGSDSVTNPDSPK